MPQVLGGHEACIQNNLQSPCLSSCSFSSPNMLPLPFLEPTDPFKPSWAPLASWLGWEFYGDKVRSSRHMAGAEALGIPSDEGAMTHTPQWASIKLKSLCLCKYLPSSFLNVGLVSGLVSQCFLPGALWKSIMTSWCTANSPASAAGDYVSFLCFHSCSFHVLITAPQPSFFPYPAWLLQAPSGDPLWCCHAQHNACHIYLASATPSHSSFSWTSSHFGARCLCNIHSLQLFSVEKHAHWDFVKKGTSKPRIPVGGASGQGSFPVLPASGEPISVWQPLNPLPFCIFESSSSSLSPGSWS